METLSITESRDDAFAADALTEAEALLLRALPGKPIALSPPSIFNDNRWVLRSDGWVGQIPLGPGRGLAIKPKIGIERLFAMLEVAYRIDPKLLVGQYHAASLPELYGRLASILAFRLLSRARKGLYRTYIARQDDLGYVRGTLDIAACMRRPVLLRFPCDFEEHSADNEDNRIVGWALQRALASGLCHQSILPVVRRALHTLTGVLEPTPVLASACTDRAYNRLNDDYRTMHALSRFLIESTGPSHAAGDRSMIPFLVDMAALFEKFVTEWLRAHLPWQLRLRDQFNLVLGARSELSLKMDLVLHHRESGRPLTVLDVKYKDTDEPSNDDVFQVVTYATALGVRDAWLVYPRAVMDTFDVTIGAVRVRTIGFDVTSEFSQSGEMMLRTICVSPIDTPKHLYSVDLSA